MRFREHGILIECVQGDIADQPGFDAVVNAANAQLAPGGGVAGALHRVAGPGLYEACRPFAPIEVGQALTTPAFGLPNRWVIHALGPVYAFEEDPGAKLALAYRSVMREAEEAGVISLALPALSTGAFGYPKREAAEVAVSTLDELLPRLQSVRHIRFVLYTEEDLQVMMASMQALWNEEPNGAAADCALDEGVGGATGT